MFQMLGILFWLSPRPSYGAYINLLVTITAHTTGEHISCVSASCLQRDENALQAS